MRLIGSSIGHILAVQASLWAVGGLLLLLMPRVMARGLGWPVESGLWVRASGAVFLGLALGTTVDLLGWSNPGQRAGVGLAGHAIVNLCLGFTIASMLAVGPSLGNRRGRMFGWMAVVSLTVMALVELGHV